MDWEQTFRDWSKPSSDTEAQKCENAATAIKKAVAAATNLEHCDVAISPQGSYHNGTNVRLDSDVDICICSRAYLFADFSMAGISDDEIPAARQSAGINDITYSFPQYKNDVEEALVTRFGREHVVRGKKAFDIHENSYRIDSDAVPAFEHRRYTRNPYSGQWSYLSGVQFLTDDNKSIINWPRQQHENGIRKNTQTGGRFKNITRVIKRLRNKMQDEGISEANPIPSFLIECLVWNVPNEGLSSSASYMENVRYVLAHVFNATRNVNDCKDWAEVSELKYLFHISQPWTMGQVHSFVDAAWKYIGFE